MLQNDRQGGYTLLELLLYVAIIGSLLMSITYFFGIIADARIKNQSASEVNDQGVALMDYLTQTIRNASSITSPTTGLTGASLTLAVPTGSLSPTIFSTTGITMGYDLDGGADGTLGGNVMNATKFTASATGAITALYAFTSSTIVAAPNNQGQMAIYSGVSAPTTLLASSGSVTLAPSTWNAFSIPSVSVTSGQTYWLVYNTNGGNNLRNHTGTASQSVSTGQTFGTWPNSWTGTFTNTEFSMYAMISSGAVPSAVQVKEGTGALVSLTNEDVRVAGLKFRNLSKPGTGGIVQISFTLSQVNDSNRNEYDHQKTFVGSAEVGR